MKSRFVSSLYHRIFLCFLLCLVAFSAFSKEFYGTEIKQEHQAILRDLASKITDAKKLAIFQKSLSVYQQNGKQNYDDIHFLLSEVRKRYPERQSTRQLDPALVYHTTKRMLDDREVFRKVGSLLKSNSKLGGVAHILKSNLDKYYGNDSDMGSLERGAELLKNADIDLTAGKIDGVDPTERRITDLKVALLYLYFALCDQESIDAKKDIFDKLGLLYPAPIYNLQELEKLLSTTQLYVQSQEHGKCVMLPNAGYVFAAEIVKTKYRGLDCSGLSCWLVDATRVSTYHLESLWKKKLNLALTTLEQGRAKELDKPPVSKMCAEYDPVNITENLDAVQPMDVVVWRKPVIGSTSGHVAIFFDWIDKEKRSFLGIDTNRLQDRDCEGVAIREFKIDKADNQAYVLRRVDPTTVNLALSQVKEIKPEEKSAEL